MNDNRQELINAFGSLFTTSEIKQKLNSALTTAKSNKKTELTQISKLKAQVKKNNEIIRQAKVLTGNSDAKKPVRDITSNNLSMTYDGGHPVLFYLIEYNPNGLSNALKSYMSNGYIKNSYLASLKGLSKVVANRMILMMTNHMKKLGYHIPVPEDITTEQLKNWIKSYKYSLFNAMKYYSENDKVTQQQASNKFDLSNCILSYAYHIPYIVRAYKRYEQNGHKQITDKPVKKVNETNAKSSYSHPALRYLMKYNSSNLSYALASYVRDGYIKNSYLHHMQGLNTNVVSTMIYMLFNFIKKQGNTIPDRVKASYLKHAIEAYRRAIYLAMEDYSNHDKMTQNEASINHKLGRSILNYAFHIPYVVREFKKSNHNQQHGTDKEVTPTNLFSYYRA